MPTWGEFFTVLGMTAITVVTVACLYWVVMVIIESVKGDDE